MSYLVLARKWRPTTFSEVIGQEHVTVTLQNAIENDRLASAYIFSGPRGVGKTTTARILAKALNCETGPTVDPCNVCDVCKEIISGNSIDVLEIDGASNRGIDEIRNLRESTRYTSAQQRSKIYIIDEVHMLTTEAFNALLKTLEEPPPHVIFIFATTEVNKIPSTILSRCQRFDFRRISTGKITEQLQKICTQENIHIDELSLSLIAKKSEGCMRDSQSLLDQVISFCGTDVKQNDVSQLLGVIGLDVYIDILSAVAEKDAAKIFTLSQTIYEKGYSYIELLAGLAEYINKVLLFKTTSDARVLFEKEEFIKTIKAQAELFNDTDLLRLYQAVVEAAHDLRWSNNPQLHVEMLLVRMTKMIKTVEFEQILSELDVLKKKAITEPKQPKQPEQSDSVRILPEVLPQKQHGSLFGQLNGANYQKSDDSVVKIEKAESQLPISDKPNISLSLSDIKSRWPKIITLVKHEKISIGSFLEEGTLHQITGNQLEIVFESSKKFHVKALNENRILIQKLLSRQLDVPVVLDFLISDDSSTEPENLAPHPDAKNETGEEKNVRDAEPVEPGKDENWIQRYPAALALIESLNGEEIN